jgi:hypothetical protein
VTAIFGLRENISFDAENVTAQIILPEGFELVSGQREWHGDVLRGKKYEISAIVKSVNTGDNLIIEAQAFYILGPHTVRGGYACLYIQVSKDHAAVSDQAFSPAEIPRPTLAEPPTEFPSKPPAEPGDITPSPPSEASP